MASPALESRDQIVRVTDRLLAEYAGKVDDIRLRATVDAVVQEFERARVRQFVPVLVDRTVRERLRG